MKTTVALCFTILFSTTSFACDETASRNVQKMLHEMAIWYADKDIITFKWGSDWDEATPTEKLSLIKTFANSDACLTGKPREINFYRKGKLVGKASPTSGINLIN
jgi:hypothetical protein